MPCTKPWKIRAVGFTSICLQIGCKDEEREKEDAASDVGNTTYANFSC